MENNEQNHHLDPSKEKGVADHEENKVREGDAAQSRPEYGSKAGAITSSREDQMPLGGNENHVEQDEDEQVKGSDADADRGGEPSI